MLKTTLAAALALCASAASAVTVDFDAYFIEGAGSPIFTGTFSGTDANGDGLLSFGELTSFTSTEVMDVGVTAPASLADLTAFGDYDLSTNEWLPNGASWDWAGNIGYFTWDGGDSSVNAYNTRMVTWTSTVPEPASLAMMGLGALALVASRRRRAA